MSEADKYITSIRRKADILRMDAKREPKDQMLQQRAEEIMALCDALDRVVKP